MKGMTKLNGIQRTKVTAHARRRWRERGGDGSLSAALQQAAKLPRRPDRPGAQGYAWNDLVLVVRERRVRTVMTRAQWDQVHPGATWDGIPVRAAAFEWGVGRPCPALGGHVWER